MSTYLIIYRWTLDSMKGAARFVYAYILRYCEKYGECACSQERIAQDLKISIITVKRCISALAKAGYIAITAAGKRKERNTYTLNNTDAATAAAERWMQANEQQRHRMPEILRVYDWMLARFGASLDCMLIANLFQLQTSAEAAADSMNTETERMQAIFSSGVQYGQRELAIMCGCGYSQLKETLRALKEENIIEVFDNNLMWKKSKRGYYLCVENLQAEYATAGNDTCKTQEQPEMILVNDDIQPEMILVNGISQPEMIPKEYIDNNNSFSFSKNTAAAPCKKAVFSADRAQAGTVENSSGGKKPCSDSAQVIFSDEIEPTARATDSQTERKPIAKRQEYKTESQLAEERAIRDNKNAAFYAECQAEFGNIRYNAESKQYERICNNEDLPF